MKTKEIYKAPQTEVFPVAVEVNICATTGSGVPDMTVDPYTPNWV